MERKFFCGECHLYGIEEMFANTTLTGVGRCKRCESGVPAAPIYGNMRDERYIPDRDISSLNKTGRQNFLSISLQRGGARWWRTTINGIDGIVHDPDYGHIKFHQRSKWLQRISGTSQKEAKLPEINFSLLANRASSPLGMEAIWRFEGRNIFKTKIS